MKNILLIIISLVLIIPFNIKSQSSIPIIPITSSSEHKSETSITLDPNNNSHLFVGSNVSPTKIGFYYSSNSGGSRSLIRFPHKPKSGTTKNTSSCRKYRKDFPLTTTPALQKLKSWVNCITSTSRSQIKLSSDTHTNPFRLTNRYRSQWDIK